MSGAAARIFSFIPTAVATLLASRVIIAHFGTAAFNGFTIAESLILLIPLNDLGVGSAVTAAFASGDPLRAEAEATTLTAGRIVAASAVGVGLVSLLLTVGGLWTTLLGHSSFGGWYFGPAVAIFALSFLPGLAPGMLLGIHRNHVTVLVQTLLTPAILVGAILLVAFSGDGHWVVILPSAALALVNLVCAAIAARLIKFSWWSLLRKLPRPWRYRGGSIRGIAGPQFVLSLTVPLTLMNDRIVLSHFSTASAVTSYGVCIQIFAPVTALVAAAAQPLWPIYVAAKAADSLGPRILRTTLIFLGGAVAMCAVLLPLSGPIGDIISNGTVRLGLMLPFAAAIMTVAYAAVYPVGMVLTTPKELRFAATVSVIAVPLNIALSIVLAQAAGAPGPLLATTAVGLGQFAATIYYIRTHRTPQLRSSMSLSTAS